MTKHNSFDSRLTLDVGSRRFIYYSLSAAQSNGAGALSELPYSLKVLAENLLRHEDGVGVDADHIRAIGAWTGSSPAGAEIAYNPTRIITPDASGMSLLGDLSAMRDAMERLGGDPQAINPQIPIDFIVDHSVIVEHAGSADAAEKNTAVEYSRNAERFAFLKWAQSAFTNIRIVPPGNGIMHQINLEYLGQVVWQEQVGDCVIAFPDCLIGMDSHTPMINALGIVGWGVGGLEAGAAMLGQSVSMTIPQVVGCRLVGRLPEGTNATDLVLAVTQELRAHGVVQKFVEFCGEGLDELPLADRATLSNMAPEYGATMGYFPIDDGTLEYLRTTGRSVEQLELVEAYAKAQGLFRHRDAPEPRYSEVVEIDLGAIETHLAGPSRPDQRTRLADVPRSFSDALNAERKASVVVDRNWEMADAVDGIGDGAVVIAAITSCTNTSNPAVLIAAGLVARNARARGLKPKPWVKTSLAPGSRIVGDYLDAAGLMPDLEALGFHIVGFGCATCMGASGPLAARVEAAIASRDLVVGAVLSGNRNFEARIHPLCKVNYLASPPLVVAYALAGTLNIDLRTESLGEDSDGVAVYLADLWPSAAEIASIVDRSVTPDRFVAGYSTVFDGGSAWEQLPVVCGATFKWQPNSTYLRRPPYFDNLEQGRPQPADIRGARTLVMAGDATTTDHISPVSVIGTQSDAGQYLVGEGVAPGDFNNFLTRRGNHHVMVRGTFANIRFQNELAPDERGGVTHHFPSGTRMTVFEAATRYREERTPVVVVAGQRYGAGSSRDWAAKGTYLLGVRAVIAESFERIHRSNLVGMGVLPLQFLPGETRRTLGLVGDEVFDVTGLEDGVHPAMTVSCRILRASGDERPVSLLCRLDTTVEVNYFLHGGMLHYALRTAL
jgi:aconitate hydratase